jgi:uncharacterized protein YgbK (DUF1537 family)
MSIVLAIVGDDLTGVVSVAGEVAARGIDTAVVPHGRRCALTATCTAVSTDSRHVPPAVAADRAADAIAAVRAAGARHCLKKVDSLLRGNIAAELKATLRGFDAGPAVCAFAAPLHGRTTVDGMQLVDDRPLAAAQDPGSHALSAAQDASVRELLASDLRVRHIPLGLVGEGPDATRCAIERLVRTPDTDAIVCDAATLDDLRVVAAAGVAAGVRLYAGTSGMAGAVADALIASGVLPAPPPVLVLSGTASAVGRAQVRDAAGRAVAALIPLERGSEEEDLIEQTLLALRAGGSVLLASSADPDATEFDPGRSREIARLLATCAHEAIRSVPVAGVVATGGDVAEAFVRALGSPRLAIAREVILGVPVATVAEGPFAGLRLAAKVGSFGPDDAFARIAGWFQATAGDAGAAWADSTLDLGGTKA